MGSGKDRSSARAYAESAGMYGYCTTQLIQKFVEIMQNICVSVLDWMIILREALIDSWITKIFAL